MIVRDDMCLSCMVTTSDREHVRVTLEFVSVAGLHSSLTRVMVPEEYGRWFHNLDQVVNLRTIPTRVRLHLEAGLIINIGHITEERWFDPRAAHEINVAVQRVSIVGQALRHINTHRARIGQRPLDPQAVGWSPEDVIVEAERLGWDGP